MDRTTDISATDDVFPGRCLKTPRAAWTWMGSFLLCTARTAAKSPPTTSSSCWPTSGSESSPHFCYFSERLVTVAQNTRALAHLCLLKSTFLGTAHQRCPSWYNFGAASGFTSWRSSHKWIALCTFRKVLRSDLIALLTLNLLFPRQTWEEQASNHPWTAECHHWVCPTWLLKYVVISKQSPYPNVCNCDVECQPWKHTHPCTKYIWRSRLAFVLFPELCEPADPPFSQLAAADLIWTVLKLKQNKLLDHQDHHQTTVQRPNLWFPHNTFNKIFLCLKCKWYDRDVRGKR